MIEALRRGIAYPAARCIPPNITQGFQTHGDTIADIELSFLMLSEDMRVHEYRTGVGESRSP